MTRGTWTTWVTTARSASAGPRTGQPGFAAGVLAGALLVVSGGMGAVLISGNGNSRALASPVAVVTQPAPEPTGTAPAPVPSPAATQTQAETPEPLPAPVPVTTAVSTPGAGGAAGGSGLPDSTPVTCPAPTQTVHTAAELAAALASALPGDTIRLAPGRYAGQFVTTVSGTTEDPIFLCGDTGAVLEGDGPKKGYVFHLNGATHWRLVGFTVRNGQKGVMADGTSGSVIQGLTVEDIGDEGIHLRAFSTGNVVAANTVRRTGLRKEKFGEGIYIGSARSNWCTHSECQPDASDRNVVRGNAISATTAESVDVKEGTTGGAVLENTFDGTGMVEGDSWVDVKGNDWLVRGNTGRVSPGDGFQTHQILSGWGTGNTFAGNVAAVNGPGFGFSLTPVAGNTVGCDNRVSGAAKGAANTPCS